MYSQYKALCSQASQRSTQSKTMKEFIQEADAEELCQMLLKVLNGPEGEKMLDNLLQAFTATTERYHDKRMKLVKAVFDALKKAKVATKHADNIVNRIVVDFHAFNRNHLTKLVDYCLDRIRNNDDDFMSWKDVLPVLLEKLEDEKSINYRGTDVSGQDYKITILRSICDIDWDSKIVTSLAKMFVEILADVKDKVIIATIMKALANKITTIELNELPPLTHQLLKLAADHNSILLFATLSRFFANSYTALSEEPDSEEMSENIVSSNFTLKELQDVESTVLYHIYQSVLDNEKGAKEYMKCLKLVVNAPEYIMEPFVLSILLQLSDLYEDQAFSILKSAVLRQIQDEEHCSSSAWLRNVSNVGLSVLPVINQVIESSIKDRQLVLKGMVNFAFVLLGIEKKVGSESHLPWEYGCKILQKIARKRSDAAATILEILVDKIVSSGTSVIQYTDCLAFMCRRLTMTVLEHQAWITTLLDDILEIPATAAAEILRAVLPLMRISGSIRDNIIMILRKALYRRGVQTRKMAVLGFLQLLKNLKLVTLNALSQSESLSSSNVASSSSLFTQATLERSSQRTSSNPWHNTNLCREILAILQKCFSHETEVRSHLYQELYYGIVKNTELTEYVVEMLVEHFYIFYENDEEVLPPLNLDKCGSLQGIDVVLQEPLADLVFALQKIYLKVASKDSPTIDGLATLLESLCKRMIKTDIEHLGIVDEIDLSDNMPKSQQKIINIKLMISVYEALIAFRIVSWSQISVDIGQSIISLFKGYTRFVEYIKRLSKKKGGKGKKDKDKDKDANNSTFKKPGRPVTVKMPNTVMDFDTISKSIVLLYNTSNQWTTEDQTDCLRGRIEFHQYILQTCLQLFQNIKTLKDNELKNYLELNKQNFFTIGETLYTKVVCELKNVNTFNATVAGLAIECFKECCELLCTLYSTELSAFLVSTCAAKSSDNLPLQIQSLIMPLKDIFIESLTEEEQPEEVSAQIIPGHLIDIVSNLVKKITFNEIKSEKVFDWMTKVGEDYENIDVQVASKLIQLILLIEDRSLEYGETIQDICVEFCAVLGKVNKNEASTTRKFQIINDDNIYIAYIAVNRMLTLKMQNVIWLLGTLNAEHTAITSLEADSEANRKKIKDKEQSLCRQFAFILRAFEILANAKIEPGPASDAIFKNMQKVYSFACNLAKYFKKKSTQENPAFQSVKFIPVIQGAGNALKHAVMDLIVHVESNQHSGKSNDALVHRNKILKETMAIPGVVQAIDMFDKEIFLLGKKTGVDLGKFTKYDAIRDFRIDSTQFLNNLEKMNVSLTITQTNRNNDQTTEESNDESDTHSESDGSPKAKKRRS